MDEPETPVTAESKPRKRLAQYTQAGFVLALALVTLVASLNLPSGASSVTSPGTLPTVTALILAALGLLLLTQRNNIGEFPGKSSILNAAAVFGIFFAATVLMAQIGFTLASAIFIVALLIYSGERKLLTLILLPVLAPLILLILFYSLLAASVPVGPVDLAIHRLFFN